MSQNCDYCGQPNEDLINEMGALACPDCREPEEEPEPKKEEAMPQEKKTESLPKSELILAIEAHGVTSVEMLAKVAKTKKALFVTGLETSVDLLRKAHKEIRSLEWKLAHKAKAPISRARTRTEEPLPEKKDKPKDIKKATPCKKCNQTGKIKTDGGYKKHYACNGSGWMTPELREKQINYWGSKGKTDSEIREILAEL